MGGTGWFKELNDAEGMPATRAFASFTCLRGLHSGDQVGDLFSHGIYDCMIHLRGYPFLHEHCEVTYSARACDVMRLGAFSFSPQRSVGGNKTCSAC